MDKTLNAWRDEGIGREKLELWAIGFFITTGVVGDFAEHSEAACAMDSPDFTIYGALGALSDDLFIIDRVQRVRQRMNLFETDLSDPENVAELDVAVRQLWP